MFLHLPGVCVCVCVCVCLVLCIFTYDLMPLLLGLPALCSVCQSVCAIIGVTVNNILL